MQTLRSAFTLIELMVVIAIMLVLSALLLVAANLVQEKAEVLNTRKRINAVADALLERSATDRVLERLRERAIGAPFQLENLRTIFGTLVDDHGLDLTYGEFPPPYPPGTASIYDEDIGCYLVESTKDGPKLITSQGGKKVPDGWKTMKADEQHGLKRKRPTLDNIIVWPTFQDLTDNFAIEPLKESPSYYIGGSSHLGRTFYWWHKNQPAEIGAVRACMLYEETSLLKENLDGTLEVFPPAQQQAAWYLQQWPLLSELTDGNGVAQHAWPDPEWDRATPGDVKAPIWEAPFGRPVINRLSGELFEGQYLVRSVGEEGRGLADFSPLLTDAVLWEAGVLSDGTQAEFRTNRNRERDWNDHWGNPLIAAVGFYIAPRYGLDPADPAVASHGLDREFAGDLLGGRDFLWRRSLELHGFASCMHMAVGALGPRRGDFGDDNPVASDIGDWSGTAALEWEEAEDEVVFRGAWLQIRELCGAGDWRDEHMTDPLWEGIEKGERGNYLSMLSAPITIR